MATEDVKPTSMHDWRVRAVCWISIFLAVVMALAGFMKVIGLPMMVDKFEHWLYPRWFLHFAGAFEIVAAGLIAYHKTRRYGAWLVMAAMFGAIITHLKYDYSWVELIVPVLFLSGAWFVNRELRPELGHSDADKDKTATSLSKESE
jgi:uncharacterized membrane protein YphA (DoxX/SURF4 family)